MGNTTKHTLKDCKNKHFDLVLDSKESQIDDRDADKDKATEDGESEDEGFFS